MPLPPRSHSHDYRALMARWRDLAQRLGIKLQVLTVVEGVKIYWLETVAEADKPAVYLSSGVHGDEAAAAWGLLVWAEENEARMRAGHFLIFPCLNPHGLRLNTRVDHRGLDINRRFHLEEDEICGPWRRLMQGRALKVGLCLHEDYDSHGCYLYELGRKGQSMLGDRVLAEVKTIAADPRKSIEGSRAKDGVIFRRKMPTDLPGFPEAIVLYEMDCVRTLTFETPSEFAFESRVWAQVEFVNAVLSEC